MEVNAHSFLPAISLKDAIQSLTEPDVLMITALIGGKVPKHLFMTENKMEPAPASRSSGSGSSRTGTTTSGPQNSVAAVKKQVLNRDATFGGHASSLQSARMAASLVSTEASLLQLKASQVLSEPEQSTLFALLHDYDKGMVTVEYLVQKITSLFKVSAGRIVLVGTNETNEHTIYFFLDLCFGQPRTVLMVVLPLSLHRPIRGLRATFRLRIPLEAACYYLSNVC